jgi:hypothetical protein
MMPEILTESFCERCGTRYTFESAAPRKTRRLGQFKTLSKGMKNWVMSDDTSLDEAMAAARNDDERELTSHQLDAFHSTFNFCMTCRQYTCGNCWNAAEGHCLTCAPHLGQEILPAAFPDQAAFEPVRIEAEAWPEVDLTAAAEAAGNGIGNGNGIHADESDPWASTGATDIQEDLDFDPAARLAFLSGETPMPAVEPEAAPPMSAAPPMEAPEVEAPALEAPPVAAAPTAPSPATTPMPTTTTTPPVAAGIFRWPTAGQAATAAAGTDAVAAEPIAAPLEDVALAVDATADAVPDAAVSAAPTEDAAPIDDLAQIADAAAASSTDETLPPTVEGRTNLGSTRTADLLRRFRPGQNIDAELEAYEAQADRVTSAPEPVVADEPGAAAEVEVDAVAVAPQPEPEFVAAEPEPVAAAPEPEPEPVAAAPEPVAAEPEPVAEPAPEPVAAAPEPESEPVAAAPEPAPEPVAAAPEAVVPAPTPAPVPVWPAPASPPIAPDQPREDRIQQPTWQIFAPDGSPAVGQPLDVTLPPVAPAQPPPAASADPQWPIRPDQIESPAMALLTSRKAGSPSDALWAASAQEVLARPASAPATAGTGVQPCSSCGLSLSATARFCRRCGTRQG